MASEFFPLMIHNASNDDIVVRYQKGGGQAGVSEARIGPRGMKQIQDAYMGMSIYASNMFDPSSAYASLSVNNYVDEVHFTESGGGYGKGSPVGPPAATRDIALEQGIAQSKARQARKQQRQQSTQGLPGDSADNHGASLTQAHSGDLLHQGGGAEDGVSEEDNGMVFVPGMGYMNRENIPPHVLQQIAMRQHMEQMGQMSQQVYQEQQYPDYDQQANAMALDGQSPLPPVRLNKTGKKKSHFGPLTKPEKKLATLLTKWAKISQAKADYYARPLFFICVLGIFAFLGYVYQRRQRKNKALEIRSRLRRRFY